MKVFKFGGASIKSAQAVKNMIDIVGQYSGDQLVLVVSAMGKTTNALEVLFSLALKEQSFIGPLEDLVNYHHEISYQLLTTSASATKKIISDLFLSLRKDLGNFNDFPSADAFYDHIVAYGERLSSTIIHAALNHNNIDTFLLNAKDVIITDDCYKEGKVQWADTNEKINETLKPILTQQLVLTQGFLGGTLNGDYTTLGREGSDFTAAIFAASLKASSVTIWKDVPGILNADPKLISGANKFENLNYHEAAEMTYYGASVIHPKTIKPLANLNIPLFVKSFEAPTASGTEINAKPTYKNLPATIFKKNQSLIIFEVKDFTFINENNLSIIFHLLDQLNIKINMMQNSAISLSICVDNHTQKINELTVSLKHDFEVHHYDGLNLITIKNYDNHIVDKIMVDKEIMLEQKTRDTFQIVVRDQPIE